MGILIILLNLFKFIKYFGSLVIILYKSIDCSL